MLSLSFICVQSILLLPKATLAVPLNALWPSLLMPADPTIPLPLPRNDSIPELLGNITNLTTWPKHPFTVRITSDPSTWISFQSIGSPGTSKQKPLLLGIIAMQLLVYTSQPPGTSPHPFTDTRHDVTFSMRYEEGRKLDMALAVSGLSLFQDKVKQWGAQDLKFSFGRKRVSVARLEVRLGTGGTTKGGEEKQGLGVEDGKSSQ